METLVGPGGANGGMESGQKWGAGTYHKLKDVESKPMNAAKQNNTDGQNNPYPLAIVTMSQ